MSILIFGARGQLGMDLQKVIPPAFLHPFHQEPETMSSLTVDVGDRVQVFRAVRRAQLCGATHVINAAAYTNTDRAQQEPQQADRVNHLGAWLVAQACKLYDLKLLHVSTDYVFPTEFGVRSPHVESEPAEPSNVYGASKWQGEQRVREVGGWHQIVRVQNLYGITSRSNMALGILEHARAVREGQKERLALVNDQWLLPTWTGDLAPYLTVLLQDFPMTGTFHVAPEFGPDCPVPTLAQWAEELLAAVGWEDTPIGYTSLDEYHIALRERHDCRKICKRPRFSVLASEFLPGLGWPQLSDWKTGIRGFAEEWREREARRERGAPVEGLRK